VQTFEMLFCILVGLLLVELLFGAMRWLPGSSLLIIIGFVLLFLGLIIEGYRWQMILAYVSFIFLILTSFKTTKTPIFLKLLGTFVVITFLALSLLLVKQLGVFILPEPTGPYAIGTFNYSLTDKLRVERFASNQQREVFVQVWYPADNKRIHDYPLRTLWQEMYSGEFDLLSFFWGYLKHINTHSHIEAPIALKEQFPVLLFNHGLNLVAEQNTVLIEHLVSHGYVVFSIAHPYESAKVNLANAGTVLRTSQLPETAGLNQVLKIQGEEVFNELVDVKGVLLTLRLKNFNVLLVPFSADIRESIKRNILANALTEKWAQNLKPKLNQQSLHALLSYLRYQNDSIDTWVKDIQLVTDNIAQIEAPIDNFLTSINQEKLGVFGMSRGGAAAGEFCKIDNRCVAGVNMDGLQYGANWRSPMNVPFLMLYSFNNSGMNDFAYSSLEQTFHDYTLKNSVHADFTDLALIVPLIHYMDTGKQIDGKHTNQIINTLHLRFFDGYLKGKRQPVKLDTGMPEVIIRNHLTKYPS
jgi:predicted dienelactone hydrolase